MNTRRRLWIRLSLLALLLIALTVGGRLLGLDQYLSAENLRAQVTVMGVWGPFIFIALFSLGELIHIPGLVFVGAGVAAYGRVWGGALSLLAAVVSVTVSFVVVRTVGGRALTEIDKPLLKRLMAGLEAHPIRTVIILRLMFWMGPPLNYALALTNLRLRDYVIGSTIGLVPILVGASLAFDWLLTTDDLTTLGANGAMAAGVVAAVVGVVWWRWQKR